MATGGSGNSSGRYSVGATERIHILVGDRTGGGHRHGAGQQRSEFPQAWTDDAIIMAIERIANSSTSTSSNGRLGRKIFMGTENSVRIKVVADPKTGRIITGFPG